MTNERRFTAFCGLYCLDCIPSNKLLFNTIKDLNNILKDLDFKKYAEFKSKRFKTFKDYTIFINVLEEIKTLECTVPCYEGPNSEKGCSPNCKIRSCVLSKGYEGCWQCNDFLNCKKLESLKDFHPGLEHNLITIKNYGLQNWISKRGKHYNW